MTARGCERPGCGDPIPSERGPRARYCSRHCQERRTFVKGGAEGKRPRRERVHVPKGVEAAELWQRADGGTVSSGPVEVRPNSEPGALHASWDWLLELHGLDPAEFEIVGETVNARTWDAHYGVDQPPRKFAYYKADFRRRGGAQGLDFNELRAAFLSQPPPKRKAAGREPVTFVLAIADPQFGKADGDGTPGTLARIENGIAAACELIEAYRAAGHNIADVLVPWLGDNTENVAGHYEMQTFAADLSLTEQIEATTDVAVLINRRLLEVAPAVLNAAVPGNHGEIRNGNGKAFTRFSDNMDTHGIKQAARVIRALPAYRERARFAFPEGEELSLTLRVRGRVHTFLHGHQGRVNAATAHARIVRWVADQALGMRAAGESEFIWSGHYHHFSAVEVGRRVFVQAPALDGGSVWYAESAGIETPPGMLTGLLTGSTGTAGFRSITVLPGDPMPRTWEHDAEPADAA